MTSIPQPDPAHGEFALIDWIAARSQSTGGVSLGIGDDCAVMASQTSETVICKDVLAEGVHFTSETPLELVGRKALAVNLSDIAAMAAQPVAAFVGIVLPHRLGRTGAQRIFEGLFQLANEWGVQLAGGDTNSWDGPLVISVTVTGKLPGPAVTRGGAQPGDWLLVTGPLGGSLPSGRHLKFTPRIREALALRDAVSLHAMLDLSDGLSSDLQQMLRSSGVGAKLRAEVIPIHPDVDGNLSANQRLAHALNDGEDFELLLAISPADGAQLLKQPPAGVSLIHIGEVTSSIGAVLLTEHGETQLHPGGYVHELS